MDAILGRPARPGDDYEWEPVPGWRSSETPKRCRMQGAGHVGCGRQAVAECARAHTSHGTTRVVWWAYCEQCIVARYHARWENGQVWGWVWSAR